MLRGKKILLGVTGSIAAYKAAFLVRLLVKEGAEVQVLATKSALAFIPALTLSTLSNKPVYSEFIKNGNGEWANHVELGLWADLMIVAPLSAKSLSAMAHGYSDNLLVATYLSARCPVIVAPAMDLDMYQHPSTLKNLQSLVNYGNLVIEANEGELASGLHGKGRMAEPEEIIQEIKWAFQKEMPHLLKGKKVVLTAGPTQEYIDPVRYISNGSSGKMGYAIAEQLATLGCIVKLVSGPVNVTLQHANVEVIKVNSAQEMLNATEHHYLTCDIGVFTAAVSDYRPLNPSDKKIKKNTDTIEIQLTKNADIAFEMGKQKKQNQINVGFALETHDEVLNAQNKMKKKNFDMIVLNSLQDSGAGFGHDTNKVTIFTSSEKYFYDLKPKKQVALDIIEHITAIVKQQLG